MGALFRLKFIIIYVVKCYIHYNQHNVYQLLYIGHFVVNKLNNGDVF